MAACLAGSNCLLLALRGQVRRAGVYRLLGQQRTKGGSDAELLGPE